MLLKASERGNAGSSNPAAAAAAEPEQPKKKRKKDKTAEPAPEPEMEILDPDVLEANAVSKTRQVFSQTKKRRAVMMIVSNFKKINFR